MDKQSRTDQQLKRLIWAYFLLLIFEGALRKWFLPSLSTPLLIVRDPVVILIYGVAASGNRFPRSAFIGWITGLALLSFLASFTGTGNLKVILFGLRADFLHLPLIFLLPQVLTHADVKKIGKWFFLISIPMALLAFEQFRSGPDARINAVAGGELGGQLYASGGRIRPAGTFSFVTGMVSFSSYVAAFVLGEFLRGKAFKNIFTILATVSLMLSLGVSGSRSAVMSTSVVLFTALVVCLLKGKLFSTALKPLALVYVAFLTLSFLPIFKEGLVVQQERFEGNGGLREGIIDRFIGDLAGGFVAAGSSPFLGYGLGLGTNAGSGILTGRAGFLLAEGEWGRVVMETGPVLGFAFIFLRIAILLHVISVAWRAMNKGNALPALLIGACGIDLLTGQFGQPTELGFAVFGSGLSLAAANEVEEENPEPAAPAAPQTPRLRGRSSYAERLHGNG